MTAKKTNPQTILEHIKDDIGEYNYNRYISKLQYNKDESNGEHIIYNAPNIFIANWVKTKYKELISNTFERELNISPLITITSGCNNTEDCDKATEKIQKNQSHHQTTSVLNPSFTFDSFVIGNSNQFAYSACKSVADNQGKNYNPLFLHGGVGLGKTHLLHAIGNEAINKGKSVVYVTIEQFMNDFTQHLRNQTMERFKDKYRTCDYLLIDDVQFLSNKKSTQEEFFHTFNELHSKQCQIVLTSDKAPQHIPALEDRLKSRFQWGLTTDIKIPELETKIAIIKKKCELDGIKLSDEIINYIAVHFDSNIREIEGVLIKLNAYSNLVNQEITLEFTKGMLKDQIREDKQSFSLNDLTAIIAEELNVKPSEIKSKSRAKQIANARRIIFYLARKINPDAMQMKNLAEFFNMKDHSSISKAMKKIEEQMDEDENFKLLVNSLENKIQQRKN